MDGLGRLHPVRAWSEARRGRVVTNLLHLSTHPDVEVRLGLLENECLPPPEADALARRELASGMHQERVRIEVVRSRQVSPALILEVMQCGEWEVWAVALHNPNIPDAALQLVVDFTHQDPGVEREFQYLKGRVKEVRAERANAVKKETGRAP